MKWFRQGFLGMSMFCLGTAAAAQEPQERPAVPSTRSAPASVGLGRPAPLDAQTPPAQANPVVNAFIPIHAASPNTGIVQANYRQDPRPTVVRATRGTGDDEPKSLFLPKEFAPLDDMNPQPLTPPFVVPNGSYANGPLPAQAVDAVPPKDKAKIIEIDKNGKPVPPPEASKNGVPKILDSVNVMPTPCLHCDDKIIIVDENGTPIFGQGGQSPRWYGSTEYLAWWTKGFHLPPLATTAPTTDPIATQGALGFGSTQVIFGNSNTPSDVRSGGRFTLGYLLDDSSQLGIEATYFFLGNRNNSFVADSSQYPVIGRPFFDLNTGMQDRELTATPGIFGTLRIDTSSQLWGAELNMRQLLCCECGFTLTGLAGFRYLDLKEGLGITENLQFQTAFPTLPGMPPLNPGTQSTVFDTFDTHNHFYGGQVGIDANWQRNQWTLDAQFKLALGGTQQTVDINGGQTFIQPSGQTQSFVGGLYAVNSNIGHFSQTRFTVVPEVTLKVGYKLTDNISLFVGYNFLYWSSVLRPGDQIDQTLDVYRVPNSGAAGGPGVPALPTVSQIRPVVPFQTSGFWAQGVTAGVMIRY